MKAAALVLSVLTLNVGGPRRVHHGWETRREALALRLKAENADAAAFQEIWRDEDLSVLSEAAGLKNYVLDRPLGLAAASRLPLVGRARRDLDWGGGVLRVRLDAPGRAADLYCARLSPGDDAPATARRLVQLFDLAEFIRAESSGPFVLLGDLAAAPDDPEMRLFLDLLGARDLCMPHGDESCGRTLDERRVDYALIPYSPRPPREHARAVFTETAVDDDQVRPVFSHFGIAAKLDASWLKLAPAAEPEGRLEALSAAVDAIDAARAQAAERAQYAGWLPWLGTFDSLKKNDDTARLSAAAERARTALSRAVKPAFPRYD